MSEPIDTTEKSGELRCSTVCEQCKMPSYYVYPEFQGRYLCRHCTSKAKYPRWIRGKYNGQRIVGLSVKIVLSVAEWRWKPMVGHYCGAFHWLCFMSWTEPKYED